MRTRATRACRFASCAESRDVIRRPRERVLVGCDPRVATSHIEVPAGFIPLADEVATETGIHLRAQARRQPREFGTFDLLRLPWMLCLLPGRAVDFVRSDFLVSNTYPYRVGVGKWTRDRAYDGSRRVFPRWWRIGGESGGARP